MPQSSKPFLAYFDYLVEFFQHGSGNRFVHLGHWNSPPPADAIITPEEFTQAQKQLNIELLSMGAINNSQSVLDVGCGLGGTIAELNDHYYNMTLTGVNIDNRQLDICRQLKPVNENSLTWFEADACDLPFPDNRFDRVFCIEAMFHFSSRLKFFQDAYRVLKHGGRLIITDIVVCDTHKIVLPNFCIDAILQEGYGPWPDPWSREGNPQTIAERCGFKCLNYINATDNTAASHQFTVPGHVDWDRDPGNPLLRSAMMLKWLHMNHYLRYDYLCFEK